MYLPDVLRILILLAAVVGLCLPAAAGIYSYTAEDGSVSLSNVPTDARYAVLVPDRREHAVPAPAVPDEAPKVAPPANKALYEPMVEQAARMYGVESALLHAVISVESRYDAKAVSPKGAQGLMQLMPGTAKRYSVADPLDPEQNVRGGAKYLRDLLQMFDRDLHLALAAYNAGENAIVRNGRRIPPILETRNYVPRVLAFYRRYTGGRTATAMP